MDQSSLERVKKGFEKPFGMILATGPTGSGKTTSIYSILKILNVREKNIATIEDPVEYEIEGINQIQVNPKTNLTFPEGLRSILRQDPDIIYVGEIRDEETASIAINSAMTGHLVLTTLHTNDAATALPRLVDMKIEPYLVASTVNIIIAQRLVRKICEKCKFSFTEKAEELGKRFSIELVKKYLGSDAELRLYKGKGCPVCHNSGYWGRVGIFEILEVSEAIKDLIVKKSDSSIISKKAIEEGMKTMFIDGLSKVQLGITTIDEIMRATSE
jgi:type II secretory ATPase GspE/PulE/Tfp pilus assembly ATPase PilB-like protein